MAESVRKFRSAMGGYRKSDVTAYIEKTASEYRSALLEREQLIAELQKENRSLQQQLNLLMMATPAPAAAEPAPAPVEAAPAPVEVKAAPAPVAAPAPAPLTDMAVQELQAYRRAAAVEQTANRRAKRLYQQLEGLCVDTMGEFQVTDSAVKKTIEVMLQQATSLEQAYQTLSAALTASREKLAAMNELISDTEEI